MKKIAIFAQHSIKLSIMSVLLLAGCAFSKDALFPSLVGSNSQEDLAFAETSSPNADMPVLGSTNFEPVEVSRSGSNTGTFVGQKVVTFRNELSQLQQAIRTHNSELQKVRASVITNAQQYHKTVASMEAKLQVGTTPGNPQMFAMLQSAQNNVQVMSASTIALNQLSNRVSADATTTAYLLESIRSTYSVSGAVDEDHRQLRVLENETSQSAIVINSLLAEVNSDASRQQQYVETANTYLLSLDGAIRQGNYNGGNTYNSVMAPMAPMPPRAAPAFVARPAVMSSNSLVAPSSKPLFVAKFNKADVNYQEGLKSAVNNAVAKKPGVMFDVVAVSPAGSNAVSQNTAQQKAAEIFKEMNNLGVDPDKVSLSARTSGDANSPEVQIFVK